jgi:chaperone required for assembly of F1-ATPase
MRDLLEAALANAALEEVAADPIAKARALNRRDLPKRFYKSAESIEIDGEYAIHLDGRAVKTPGKKPLRFPRADLADVAAAEWAAQGTHIDPATMPMTRLGNSVVDGVVERRTEVAEDALKYAASDLLCYRATSPTELVDRQTAAWDPVLDWVEERFGARFLVSEGILHVNQEAEALQAIREYVVGLDPWRLAGLHQMTTIGGSILVALAVTEARLSVAEGWAVAVLDDLWALEKWGADEEAEMKLAARQRDFEIAAKVALGP